MADVFVASMIAAIAALIIRKMKNDRKKGSGCCSGCAGCSKAKNCLYR